MKRSIIKELYYKIRARNRQDKEMMKYREDPSLTLDLTTKETILTVPIPMVVTELDGTIIWYNPPFNQLIKEGELIGNNLGKYLEDLGFNFLSIVQSKSQEVKFNDKVYSVTCSPIQMKGDIGQSKTVFIFYWQDSTAQKGMEEKYRKDQLVLAYVYVDNYDEVLANTDGTDRPMVIAEIEGRLGKWAMSLNAGWQKYERGKFLMIMDSDILDILESKKFDILDHVREIDMGNQMTPTLSIGVGVEANTPARSANYAHTALDMALGRGGDQAVVKRGSKLYFYGGKTKAVERRTKVKSRVIAGVLRELMEQSRDVFIMSHELPDLDSIGSALGLYRCAKHIDKEAHIILKESNPSVQYLVEEIIKREEYQDLFISPKEAIDGLDSNSLLIVVDTHRPSFTEVPELLNLIEKVVVIDHHRRSAESIENSILTYLEPYASSTSELVAEIVQYFDEKLRLKPLEADALLAGITMDTKSFTFKTGVRTFEAASYLKRAGADPTSARQFFKDDIETYIARSETVKQARILAPGIATSQCPPGVKNPSLIAAQAADSLLTIRGIHASFVLAQVGDGVIISGRSLGNINVQLILEKLGGGGHLTIAGAQLENISMEEAKSRITNAVEEYLSEEGESK